MTIIDMPGFGAGIKSVFEGAAIKSVPVSGRLRQGAQNILAAAKAVHEALAAQAVKAGGIDVKA